MVRSISEMLTQIALEAKSVILMSHLGRPDGTIKMEYSLRPVADCLSSLMKRQEN